MTKKSKKNAVKANPNAWMVTFGDLIMLLLTFFVLLLTMKSVDSGKSMEMFKDYIQIGGSSDYMEGSSLEGDSYGGKSVSIVNSEMLKNILELMEGVDTLPAKEGELKNLKDLITITDDKRGVVITTESGNLFYQGEAEVRTDRLFVLDAIGKMLRYASNDILVMGNTDNKPVRGGNFESNLELSFYRALGVYYYLTDSLGLNPERLAVGGYGATRRLLPNNSLENQSKNRRVEFILRKPI